METRITELEARLKALEEVVHTKPQTSLVVGPRVFIHDPTGFHQSSMATGTVRPKTGFGVQVTLRNSMTQPMIVVTKTATVAADGTWTAGPFNNTSVQIPAIPGYELTAITIPGGNPQDTSDSTGTFTILAG